jgi:gluconate 2-dehydrogenase gamma chain
MPPPPGFDRRTLLKLGGGVWASALLAIPLATLAQSAAENRAKDSFVALTPSIAATVEAVAARILPTTNTPGAREAGAIWFIDAALGGTLSPNAGADMSGALPLIEGGARDLDQSAADVFAAVRFVDLAASDQDALLRQIEDGEFFGLLRFLTLAGTFTMPGYRGNRGEVGWDLLGFERRHHWEVPFGHYDAEVHGS